MELGLFDVGEDGKTSGVGLAEIPEIFALQNQLSVEKHHLMMYGSLKQFQFILKSQYNIDISVSAY